jgi:hypothetical protein
MKAADIRKRIDAITTALQGTLAARLRGLTVDDQNRYRAWRADRDRWFARHEHQPGGAYAAILEGTVAPQLPGAIQDKLFKPMLTITSAMTTEQAAEVYASALREG